VIVALGIDLGWHGKPTGVAAAVVTDEGAALTSVGRLSSSSEILKWIELHAGADCVCAVDAPLVIPNANGIRRCERELNAKYGRCHAGCHPAHQGRPFAKYVTAFSDALRAAGFHHGPAIGAMERGRWQIEVYPHAASVSLFSLSRIVKYKKGRRVERGSELQRQRSLVCSLPLANQELIPAVPERGGLKYAEDQIDAVLCAYIAAHWWRYGGSGSEVFGSETDGYIVVPLPRSR
jgi:predicted RNase H-like nuclease